MNVHRSAVRMAAAALAVVGLVVSLSAVVQAEPMKIRMGWVISPPSLIPLISKSPATKHYGKSYVIEDTRIGASSQQITALAADQIDIAALNYSSTPLAIINAKLEDIRIIADEIRDGQPGYYSATYWVRKDSGINKVEDLKGKTLAVNGHGTGVEMALTVVLQNHGLDIHDDAHVVEVPFPHMAATLMDKKVDLAEPPTAFTLKPGFTDAARPLFYMRDAFGVSTLSFWTARKGYIATHRKVLVDLIEDYIRSIRWYTDPKNHEKAVEVASKFTKLPAKIYAPYLFTKKDFYHDHDAMVDMKALQSNVALAAKLKVIPRTIEMKKYADLSLAREAAKRIK